MSLLSKRRTSHVRILGIVAAALVLFPFPLKAQDAGWQYKHFKDPMTDKQSDLLALQGHYINGTPSLHENGAPAIVLSCSSGKISNFTILTGVVLEAHPNIAFGTTIGTITTIRTRIDARKPKTDRIANVAEDLKTLKFKNLYLIGGNDIFFAKTFIVAVDSGGNGNVEMEFDVPADTSLVERYCGVKRKTK